MRAAVIGATGFAGRALVPVLHLRTRIETASVLGSGAVASYWLHLVTQVRAAVARPLIEGFQNPTVARDDRIRRLLPIPLTGFCDAARRALDPVTADPPREGRVAVPRNSPLRPGEVR